MVPQTAPQSSLHGKKATRAETQEYNGIHTINMFFTWSHMLALIGASKNAVKTALGTKSCKSRSYGNHHKPSKIINHHKPPSVMQPLHSLRFAYIHLRPHGWTQFSETRSTSQPFCGHWSPWTQGALSETWLCQTWQVGMAFKNKTIQKQRGNRNYTPNM